MLIWKEKADFQDNKGIRTQYEMEVAIKEIGAIGLEFGSPALFTDPKKGLLEAGPFDMRFGPAQLKEIRMAIVGTKEMNQKALFWLERIKRHIPTIMKNFIQYPDFGGFESIYRCSIITNSIWIHEIPEELLTKALGFNDEKRFEAVLELYAEGMMRMSGIENNKPNIILCTIPDGVIEACHHVERKLSEKETFKKLKANKFTNQLMLFEEEESEEELLYRNFRRALKSNAILAKIPIQLGTDKLFLDFPNKQDAATRAWNFSVAIYYKAGGIPWRLKKSGPETCFVGITFHHLKTNQRLVVKSCLAQAFSSEGEGFALRGGDIPYKPGLNRIVHLSEEQAYELGAKIICKS